MAAQTGGLELLEVCPPSRRESPDWSLAFERTRIWVRHTRSSASARLEAFVMTIDVRWSRIFVRFVYLSFSNTDCTSSVKYIWHIFPRGPTECFLPMELQLQRFISGMLFEHFISIGLSDGRPTGTSAMNTIHSSRKVDLSASPAPMPLGSDINEAGRVWVIPSTRPY